MKNFFFFFFFAVTLQAQVNLLGISTYDDNNGNGFVYKIQNGSLQHVYDFQSVDTNGKYPSYGLVEYNGLYYGVVGAGSENNKGAIFSYNYATNTITIVHHFDSNKGYGPSSPLILYNDKFYGFTAFGSDAYKYFGVFFEFDPVTGAYQSLYEIADGSEGLYAANIIIEDNIMYGTFNYGGTGYNGTLFSLNLTSHTYNVLHQFESSEGKPLFVNPVLYNNALFGTISSGYPPNNNMYIYKYDLSNNTFEIVKDFSSESLGFAPSGYIVLDNGIIYGTTNDYGNFSGHIFQYDIDANQLTSVYDITDNLTADLRGLVKYDDTLYCLTNRHILFGGTSGEIISYNLTTGTYQYHFAFQEGASELNFITKVGNNKMIGLRKYGSKISGEIFEADLNNNTYQTKYTFNIAPNGGEPYNQFLQGGNGKYYGMTRSGGDYGYGVVYEMDNNGNLEVIYHFTNFNHERMILSGDKIYFKKNNDFVSIDINTHQLNVEVVLDFATKSYIQASNGKIYMIKKDNGFVYEFNPATGNINLVAYTNDYADIQTGITEYNGKLYYFANIGYLANNVFAGFLLSYDLATQQIELVKEFDDVLGTPMIAKNLSLTVLNNRLYGHTTRGGANNYGTLFELIPGFNVVNKILDLTEDNLIGQKLVPVGNHTLLGTFSDKILAFDIQNATQDLVYDLSNNNIRSSYVSLLDIGTTAIDKEVLTHFEVYPNPMIDVLQIENKDNTYQATSIRIFDMSGKEKINTTQFNKIDVSHLSKGIYILQLQLQNGNSVQQLLLKK